MTPSQIYAQCQALEKLITSRGFLRPEVAFFVNFFSGRPFSLKVELRITESYESALTFYPDVQTEDEIPSLFETARVWISEQKNPETIRREQFIAALGRVIDQGKAINMPVDFMNPLVESMKRLSENVLEFKS